MGWRTGHHLISVDELLLLAVQGLVQGGGQVLGEEDLQLLGSSNGGVAGHGEGPGHGIDKDAQCGLNVRRLENRIKLSLAI